MRCPGLNELPAPPPGKAGWPWTEESARPAGETPESAWPRISVVTPSYNQGRFLEETIRSILLQGYPNLEYFVLDGGSTDESVEIIRKYAPWLTYWVSAPDGGQSDAINRGLNMASGALATWINSDDLLCRDALVAHAARHGCDPNVIYVGDCLLLDETGRTFATHRARVHSLEDLLRVKTVWRARGYIVQPEVLFPRELALSVGGLDRANHWGMDYELWGKLLLAGARLQYTEIPFGMFRNHPDQKTGQILNMTESLLASAERLTRKADGFAEETRRDILAGLEAYGKEFRADHFRNSGRLARIGLPAALVNSLRAVRSRFRGSPR